MDLDATPFRYFVAVAEERSFTRAAARLHVSQPALSAQIREFERRLGFALFARTSRRVELTVEGRLFLGNARRMVSETATVNQAALDIRTNQLRLGAPFYTLLIAERRRLVDDFVLAHPEIRLRVFERSHARTFVDLGRREIDLAIVVEPSAPARAPSPTRQAASDAPEWPDAFERLHLGERRVALLVPTEHRLAGINSIPLAALAGERIATVNRSQGVPMSEMLSRRLADAGATPVRPPEAHAVGVERYGHLTRMPAITLGWFDWPSPPAGLVVRQVDGFDLNTSLSLVRMRGEQRPAALLLWQMAEGARQSA